MQEIKTKPIEVPTQEPCVSDAGGTRCRVAPACRAAVPALQRTRRLAPHPALRAKTHGCSARYLAHASHEAETGGAKVLRAKLWNPWPGLECAGLTKVTGLVPVTAARVPGGR
jgi:hypothetical protein